jgi:hypothetical protein
MMGRRSPGTQLALVTRRHRDFVPNGARETADDEVIGVVDPFADVIGIDRPVERHGVPVPLVEVVPGLALRCDDLSRLAISGSHFRLIVGTSSSERIAKIFPPTFMTNAPRPKG